jgi:hypothetical protein
MAFLAGATPGIAVDVIVEVSGRVQVEVATWLSLSPRHFFNGRHRHERRGVEARQRRTPSIWGASRDGERTSTGENRRPSV